MSLSLHEHDVKQCTYCPKLCRFSCPTAQAEHRETVTPWAKMSLAEMWRSERLPATPETAEIFYHCFLCLHCRTYCKHEVDVPSAMQSAREKVVELVPQEQLGKGLTGFLEGFLRFGNPYGEDLRPLLQKEALRPYLEPEAQVMVFVGCRGLKNQDDSLAGFFRLLEKLEIDYVGVHSGAELCCGSPLWQAGHQREFLAHARTLRAQLSRVRKIICPCPTCAYALHALYAQVDAPLAADVVHISEFVDLLLGGREPVRKLKGSYVFHDPCYLSRYLNQSNIPRAVLGKICNLPLPQLPWQRDDTFCCGGGGLVRHLFPEVAASAAAIRMEQLRATGAEKVVTACPGCLDMLQQVKGGLPVVDFLTVIEQAYL